MAVQDPTPPPVRAEAAALGVLEELVSELARRGIAYVHWKSNVHVRHAMAGIDDFDVLVERRRFEEFVAVLYGLGFRPAESVTSRSQPGVFHFLGNDPATGSLVNVHAYARILTGDHFLKSWAWPVEGLLLESPRQLHGVSVPDASAELVVFVLRALVKRLGLVDRLWRARKRGDGDGGEELAFLLADADLDRAADLCRRYLPELDRADLEHAVAALRRGRAGEAELRRLGRRVARSCRKYRRYGWWSTTWRTAGALARMVRNRLGGRKHMQLRGGGKVIAFVGPQACGKSTLIGRLSDWLGAELSVRRMHVGKPPATWLTWLPTRAIPLLRRLMPGRRTMNVERSLDESLAKAAAESAAESSARSEARPEEVRRTFPPLYVLRKVMLAWDRRALLRKAFRWSRAGEVVLCDRYPSDRPGAVDSTSFTDEDIAAQRSGWVRRLMRLERSIYDDVASPDLVIELSVPVEVALARNLERVKDLPQSQEYVKFRHGMRRKPRFDRSPMLPFESTEGLEEFVVRVKREVWARM